MDSEWNIPIGVANNWPLCADASLFTSWAAQRAAHFNVSEWARRAGEMVGGNVSLLDTYTSIDPLRGYERDGIHPNALGYTQAAERVLGWLAAH
jgi:lysophospholipase L1-like esterase